MPLLDHHGLQIEYASSGEGPPVLLVHSSVSGHRQWKKLAALLGDRHRVIAPHLRGYGETSAWPDGAVQTLHDAAEVVLALCARLDGPIRLVGHSWGGAVALWAARVLGPQVSHLALYEPMLPGLLLPHGRAEAAAEAAALLADVRRLSRAGDWHAYGRRFTDYFNGEGAWDASPPPRQQAIVAALPPNAHEWEACSTPILADSFAGIRARVLLLCGGRTRRVLRDIAAVLAERFAHWDVEELAGCGHMAPLTHAERVNERLLRFLAPAAVAA